MRNLVTFSILFIITNSALVSDTVDNNIDDLLAVVVYFRHGDRTPESSFPTDEYFIPENFPMGLGQLTNKGLNRHLELGQWFRNRYDSFLPEYYSPDDIYVRATDVDRTLMSAAANLAAVYPPKNDQIWNQNLLWRPVPIHTVPSKEDNVLAMKKDCPRYNELYKEAQNSTFYQNINEKYADLYEYISKFSGFNVTDINSIRTTRSVLYVYENYNSSYIPSWADSLNQTLLDYLAGLTYQRYTFTAEMKRLRAGPFFDYLVSYFDDVTNNVTGTRTFLMLSSHDTEMVSVLDSMGAYDLYPPNFAATIIWELRRNSSIGANYVNVLYKKSSSELVNLRVNNCEFDCQFEQFKAVLRPVTVDQYTWDEECLSAGNKISSYGLMIIHIFVLIIGQLVNNIC